MRRDERVTVQGPVKEQQPDGMSHRGGGGVVRVCARAVRDTTSLQCYRTVSQVQLGKNRSSAGSAHESLPPSFRFTVQQQGAPRPITMTLL